MVSCRMGNCSRTVSCRDEQQWRQAGQETIRKQFPIEMKHDGAKSNRKPYAKSSLTSWNTAVPCRIGKPSHKGSRRVDTLWSSIPPGNFIQKKLGKNVDSFFPSFFYLSVLQISATASTSFTGMRWAPAAWISRRACTSSLERVMPVSLPPFSMAFITVGGMKIPGTLLFR